MVPTTVLLIMAMVASSIDSSLQSANVPPPNPLIIMDNKLQIEMIASDLARLHRIHWELVQTPRNGTAAANQANDHKIQVLHCWLQRLDSNRTTTAVDEQCELIQDLLDRIEWKRIKWFAWKAIVAVLSVIVMLVWIIYKIVGLKH